MFKDWSLWKTVTPAAAPTTQPANLPSAAAIGVVTERAGASGEICIVRSSQHVRKRGAVVQPGG